MSAARPLPELMVAPNGARRTKEDHRQLPLTLHEIVETAVACAKAGADGLHLHIRDDRGAHSLDPGLYRETMAAIRDAVPDLFVQATSEAAGKYTVEDQRAMIRALRPASVSVALREMIQSTDETAEAAAFYAWADDQGIDVQHIAYSPDELDWLIACFGDGTIPGDAHQIQLVLGSYASSEPPPPDLLDAYTMRLRAAADRYALDWMVCAFGPSETRCLADAALAGGKVRVGFENSLWNSDGTLARDNAERVTRVKAAMASARRTSKSQTVSPRDK